MARLRMSETPRGLDDGLPSGALIGSMSLHMAALLFLMWGATRITLPAPARVYQVELVPAPREAPVRPVPAPREAVKVAEPEPQPESKTVETKPTVTERPKERARPAEKPEEKPEEKKEPAVEERPAAPPESKPEGEVDQPVRLEGARFPYPDYLANIILQIKRHWRPPSGGRQLRAELAFTIQRDGSVEDVAWIRRSGNAAFDLEARGAIETAGRRKAFGPLPEEYPLDRLRVSFFFDPTRY